MGFVHAKEMALAAGCCDVRVREDSNQKNLIQYGNGIQLCTFIEIEGSRDIAQHDVTLLTCIFSERHHMSLAIPVKR